MVDESCPECHNPKGTRHHEACSGVYVDDFVGVRQQDPHARGPIHLIAAGAERTTCCDLREAAVPHSQSTTMNREWATCPGLDQTSETR